MMSMKKNKKVESFGARKIVWIWLLLIAVMTWASAAPKQKIHGFQNQVPQMSVPVMEQAPSIDGVVDEIEWRSASGFTELMSPNGKFRHPYVAPEEMQAHVRMGRDDQHFYLALVSAMPPSDWPKRNERLRADAVKNDDAAAIERGDYWEFIISLGGYNEAKRFPTKYIFKMDSKGHMSDQRVLASHKGSNRHLAGIEWNSGAIVKAFQDKDQWSVEMAIPLEGFDSEFHPKNAASWRVLLTRGRLQNFWDQSRIEWNAGHGHFLTAEGGLLLFGEAVPAVQMKNLGQLRRGEMEPVFAFHNPTKVTQNLAVDLKLMSVAEVWSEHSKQIQLSAGQSHTLRWPKEKIPFVEGQSARVEFEVTSAGNHLLSHSVQTFPLTLEEHIRYNHGALVAWPIDSPWRDTWNLDFSVYPYFKGIDVRIDNRLTHLPEEIQGAKACRVEVYRGSRRILERKQLLSDGVQVSFRDVEIKAGAYEIHGQLLNEKGEPVGPLVKRSYKKHDLPWEHNKIGISNKSYKPFRPLQVKSKKREISSWGYRFQLGDLGLPNHLKSTEEQDFPVVELLKTSKLKIVRDGQVEWVKADPRITNRYEGRVEFSASVSVKDLDIELQGEHGFEGWSNVKLILHPKGSNVKLDRVELIFEFSDKVDAIFTQRRRFSLFSMGLEERPVSVGDVIWDNGVVNKRDRQKSLNVFTPVIVLGNGDASVWWLCDGDETWLLDYEKPSQKVIKREQGYDLVQVLVNTPSHVSESLVCDFSMQFNPCKPMPKGWKREAWGQKKRLHDTSGYGYWGEGIDSIQLSSPDRAKSLADAVESWRQRDPEKSKYPVVLYHSGEFVSGDSKDYASYAGEWSSSSIVPLNPEYVDSDLHTQIKFLKKHHQDWRSQPKRLGAYKAEMVQSMVDYRVWCYEKNMRELNIQGYWYDNASIWPGSNPSTFQAYVTKDGELRPRYATRARHELFKRLFILYKEAGKDSYILTNNHTSFAFTSWRWHLEGDAYVYKHNGTLYDTLSRQREYDIISRLKNSDNKWFNPIARHRAMLNFQRNLGAYATNVKKNHRGSVSVYGLALLHQFAIESGVTPELKQKFDRAFESFGFFEDGVEYHPYWRNADLLTWQGSPDVVCSLYRHGKQALLVVANPRKTSAKINVKFLEKGLGFQPTFAYEIVSGGTEDVVMGAMDCELEPEGSLFYLLSEVKR